MKPGATGLTRIINATRYSIAGIKAAWKHEAAFRQECLLCLILLPAAFWLGDTAIEQILLISSLFLVVIAEILNSAIEAVVDRFGGEQHELSGRAKDMGSAAVFLSLLYTAIVWGLILFEKFH